MYGIKYTSVSNGTTPELMRWVKEKSKAHCNMDCPIMECPNCETKDDCLTEIDLSIIRVLYGSFYVKTGGQERES